MLRKLADKKHAKMYVYFAKPVDVNLVNDYYKYVRHPMDFSTVKEKLETFKYLNYKQFIDDIKLIFSNAKKYNGTFKDRDPISQIVYDAAVMLEEKMESHLQKETSVDIAERLCWSEIRQTEDDKVRIEASQRLEKQRLEDEKFRAKELQQVIAADAAFAMDQDPELKRARAVEAASRGEAMTSRAIAAAMSVEERLRRLKLEKQFRNKIFRAAWTTCTAAEVEHSEGRVREKTGSEDNRSAAVAETVLVQDNRGVTEEEECGEPLSKKSKTVSAVGAPAEYHREPTELSSTAIFMGGKLNIHLSSVHSSKRWPSVPAVFKEDEVQYEAEAPALMEICSPSVTVERKPSISGSAVRDHMSTETRRRDRCFSIDNGQLEVFASKGNSDAVICRRISLNSSEHVSSDTGSDIIVVHYKLSSGRCLWRLLTPSGSLDSTKDASNSRSRTQSISVDEGHENAICAYRFAEDDANVVISLIKTSRRKRKLRVQSRLGELKSDLRGVSNITNSSVLPGFEVDVDVRGIAHTLGDCVVSSDITTTNRASDESVRFYFTPMFSVTPQRPNSKTIIMSSTTDCAKRHSALGTELYSASTFKIIPVCIKPSQLQRRLALSPENVSSRKQTRNCYSYAADMNSLIGTEFIQADSNILLSRSYSEVILRSDARYLQHWILAGEDTDIGVAVPSAERKFIRLKAATTVE